MRSISLVGLLIAIAGGVFIVYENFRLPVGVTENNNSAETVPSGLSIINDAKEAAKAISTKSSASLVEVYNGIRIPSDSTTLDVSNRDLTGSLKAEIRHVPNLKTLDMSNNKLTGIPAEIGQLHELVTLNLSGNPFTGLPHELGNLSKLQILDLRGTSYSEADLAIIKTALPPTTKILTD